MKKSRVYYASYRVYKTRCYEYVQPVPFDKKRREIPTSVNCLYNLEYVSVEDSIRSLDTI
ncbi:hypothetical protein SCBWM1_gp78 [Synechococcus phage S-CBWM1]|uniref:Uncharacterized protein n=1 Tax=Synechococcus phage S-CBWM1 TaxID=2053653 RepID=A0A3G1L3J9_9CAUD|nr:hypothetical protein HOU61_gp119 [Synechococcus phage S-CBWM1]ATW62762.1 hypothetical protein SCBWM1_gp78 [Synechococcus phage S-CBWM1]